MRAHQIKCRHCGNRIDFYEGAIGQEGKCLACDGPVFFWVKSGIEWELVALVAVFFAIAVVSAALEIANGNP